MRRVRLVGLVAALLLVVAAAVLLGRAVAFHLQVVEAWIEDVGPWAFAAYVGVFLLLTTVFVPDTLLAIVAGAVFGMVGGVLAVSAAGILAAVLQYLLARTVLRDRIEGWLSHRPRLAAIRRAVLQDQVRLQWFLRLTPFNPTTVSYLLGASGVRFGPYLLACLGLIPAFVVEVYVGHAGRDLASASARRAAVGAWHEVLMFGGLAACLLVLAWLVRKAKRAVEAAVSQVESDNAESGSAPGVK